MIILFWTKKKENNEELPNCFARTYVVELFFDKMPEIPVNDILALIKKRCGNVDLLTGSNSLVGFIFKDNIVKFQDGEASTQIAVMVTDKMVDLNSLEMTFYQSWRWKEAKSIIPQCKSTMVVTDLLASGLNYQVRLEIFQKTLYSILELVPCLAIHWQLTQQLIDPKDYLANKPEAEDYNLLFGAVNVRLFNLQGTNGEMIMDTLGLGCFGLPDLQCHFKDIDATEIANILYGYAGYIFDKGDVIVNGNTIQGITPEQKWKCQHEISMIEPKRVVLDINPGEPYAAGKRK